MRLMELRGLPVIDPHAARRIGIVSDIHVDPAAGRLAAVDVQAPSDGGDESEAGEQLEQVAADQIRRVGRSAVMLKGGFVADASRRPGPKDDWLDLDTLVGLEVLGDGGDRVGNLVDAHFNPDSLSIEGYELAVPPLERWFGGGGRITPEIVVACSRDLMIIRASRHSETEEEPKNGTVASGSDLTATH